MIKSGCLVKVIKKSSVLELEQVCTVLDVLSKTELVLECGYAYVKVHVSDIEEIDLNMR